METVHTRASRRPRIFIADDHAVFAEALSGYLERMFDVIGLVADGRAMLEESIRLRPDVIVADVSMPLLNGLDSARRIREQTQRLASISFQLAGFSVFRGVLVAPHSSWSLMEWSLGQAVHSRPS